MSLSVQLRPVQPDDEEQLAQIYASTRQQELAVTGWPQAQIDAFLRQQFTAQQRHYSTYYPDARHDLLLLEQAVIGRLYVERTSQRLHVIDISLLPDWRGRGIGGQLLAQLLAEADSRAQVTSIHVERHNPALRLYQRLGFQLCEDKGIYLMLERQPRG
ncbi:GNAT family N-acetyltransferase [Pseudomonas jilinensis]|uniref:GNAT family N-acetyltransferase n=1 Tax=Pseudomonas jilinensis TaxID=2078689 RepID=A0A396RU25_9PSED|nr:GNAT family N-acetyltransferase [Pseudomonas jilinensis]